MPDNSDYLSWRSETPGYQFLDTNILVYAHDQSAGDKHTRSVALLKYLWESGLGCLSMQVLQEFYVTVTRKVFRPMNSQDAAKIVEQITYWRLHLPTSTDMLAAIDLVRSYEMQFWDAMIAHSAIQLGCETIWSENLPHGRIYGGVTVRNPFLI